MKLLSPLLAILAVMLVGCALGGPLECDDPIGCVSVEPDEPIFIASALVISGPDAQLGLDSQFGVEIAMDHYGQIHGHEVHLVPTDSQCTAEGGEAAATEIVADPSIVGVIGTSCSGAAVSAAAILADNGYVMISPSNTAPSLTDPAERAAGYFRTANNDNIQGRAMAEYAYNELGARTAAAIHDGDPYTSGLAAVFADVFEELGGEIIAVETESSSAMDVSPTLADIAAAGPPDFLYYPVFLVLGTNLTRQAGDVPGLSDTVLAGADGLLSQDFLSALGPLAAGMVLSGPQQDFDEEIYGRFLETYAGRYGGEPDNIYHAQSYDATTMLLDAIDEVALVGGNGALLIPRQALRDQLTATTAFSGITGELSCDENGDCADAKIAVYEVREAGDAMDFVEVWSYTP